MDTTGTQTRMIGLPLIRHLFANNNNANTNVRSRVIAHLLELALQNTYVGEDENTSVVIQQIIRSFDPYMVCTVH